MSEKVLDYPLTEAKAEIVDGERSQAAIVNQEPKGSVVNTISVKEVKEEIGKVKQCDCEPVDRPKRIYVDNIQTISGTILEDLKCGDVVVKHTVEGGKDLYHTYVVTHKQATGICITYFACGYLETISYDKIEGVWTFNSKDVWTAE